MNRLITLTFATVAILLAGCGPLNTADPAGEPLQAWIDAPLDGSTLPVAAYTLVFSGASFGDPIGNFEVWVNGVQQGTVPPIYQNSQGNAQYSYAQFEWLPPAPGNYLLQVRALSGELVSQYASASVLVGELPADVDGQPTAPAGPDVLVAVPDQNANCRFGNGNSWDIADTLFEGQQYSPLGRGVDNLWVLFSGPATNTNCWAFINNLTLLVNDVETDIANISEELLPYVPYPATPTPEPTATFTPEPTPAPQCSDGIDNDGDGDIDYPDDGRCLSPDDDNESG